MRSTSFGKMSALELPSPLTRNCEVMQFEKPGRYHTHLQNDEIAIAVSGSGWVIIEGKRHRIESGQFIRISAGLRHYMEPDEGVTLAMLIGYSVG